MNSDNKRDLRKAKDLIDKARELIQRVQSYEQDVYNEMSRKCRRGTRGEKQQEMVQQIEQADSYCENAVEEIDGVLE